MRTTLSAQPLRPTVIRFGRVGDMIMLSALLHYLHRRYRKPCDVVGAGPWNAAVFQGHPDVEQISSFARHAPFPFSLTWPRVLRSLHRSDPGPIYVCEFQYRQLPRIKRLLAFSGINRKRCVFIDDDPARGDHWVDSLLRFGESTPAALSEADYPLPSATTSWAPRLQILDTERAERDAWLTAKGWFGRQLILVQPGNHRTMSTRRDRWRQLNTDDKAWPTADWVTLLGKMHARMPNALIVLRGAVEEVPMLQEIQAATGLQAVVVAGLALRPLFALCEVSHSMISVDTGPAHAAAALGLPLVVMYGSESPNVWLPRSPSGSPVLSVGGPPMSKRADQIPVETVFDTWCTLLQQMQVSTAYKGSMA
jgi:heptosyltransferase-2/heptosyltransferase-3